MLTLGIEEKMVTQRPRKSLASWADKSFFMANPDVLMINPLCNTQKEINDGLIFPEQCQSKGKKETGFMFR